MVFSFNFLPGGARGGFSHRCQGTIDGRRSSCARRGAHSGRGVHVWRITDEFVTRTSLGAEALSRESSGASSCVCVCVHLFICIHMLYSFSFVFLSPFLLSCFSLRALRLIFHSSCLLHPYTHTLSFSLPTPIFSPPFPYSLSYSSFLSVVVFCFISPT